MRETSDARDGPGTPYLLTQGQTFGGTISSGGDHDWIAIDLVADNVFFFEATWQIADMDRARYDLNLYVRDENGIGLGYADFDIESQTWWLAFRPIESGRYYLDFASSNRNEGTYSVTWTDHAPGMEGADAPAMASTHYELVEGQSLQGFLGGTDQGDWLRIPVTPGQIYEVSVALDIYDPTFDRYLEEVVVELRNASSALLKTLEIGGMSGSFQFGMNEATDAFIAIRQRDAADSGGYSIDLHATQEVIPPATHSEAVDYMLLGFFRDFVAALNAQILARDGPGGAFLAVPTQPKAFTAPGRSIEVNSAGLGEAQRAVFYDALHVWTDATGLQFHEGNTVYRLLPNFGPSYEGMITASLFDLGSDLGWATTETALVNANLRLQPQLLTRVAEGDALATARLHGLIGQSLGLGGLSAPPADGRAFSSDLSTPYPLRFRFDGPQMSLMHSRSPEQNPFVNYTSAPVIGPMQLDILAIDRLYGNGPDRLIGDTVWGVGTTVGNISSSLFAEFASGAGSAVFYTIVDEGGADVLSFAGSDRANRIDLGPGMASDIAGTVGTLVISSTSIIESAIGGNTTDAIWGNDANNRLEGRGGNDSLHGLDGLDTLDGGAGDDFLFGGSTTADLRDVIYGGDGNDSIDGGWGNDDLNGGEGNDTILGGFGSDTVIGNAGNDLLAGGAGSDLMFGGPGNDTLNGGFGFDRLNGGTGADSFFHLGVADHASDWIQDYSAADGDVLTVGIAGATRAQFQVNRTFTAGAGDAGVQEAFIIYRPTGQILWALVDGGDDAHINIAIGGQEFDLLA